MIVEERMRGDGRMDDRTGPAAEAGSGGTPTWEAFEARLAATLGRMAVDTYLIVSARVASGTTYYVQFAQGGRTGFRAEAVSNAYLEGPGALSPDQEERLGALGWQWPATRGVQDRNFSRQWPMPVPYHAVARLAVGTLRDVYAVESPRELVYRRFDDDGRVFDDPELGIEREPAGESGAERPHRVDPERGTLDDIADAGVQDFLCIDRVVRDDMGDIPIRVDDVVLFVRVLDGPSPAIRVFSPIGREVRMSPDLLVVINEMNQRLRYARVLWAGGDVILASEVPGAHATAGLVSAICAETCALASALGEELAARPGFEQQTGGPRHLLH